MAPPPATPTRPLRILSLGAGVQSSALAVLAVEGAVDPIDAAVFADTRWEPPAVYRHLDEVLTPLLADAGVPLHRVGTGSSIRDDHALAPPDLVSGRRRTTIPFFAEGRRGATGRLGRSCTGEYKLGPIRRKVRELYLAAGRPPVEQYVGISLDEVARMKPSGVTYIRNRWPLIDLRLTRADCQRLLAERGITAPRSSCIGCPFHSNREWRRLRDGDPAAWGDAVAFEREVQARWERGELSARGRPFLHASLRPLDAVDLSTPEDHGQGVLFSGECEGMCGV